jgi:hypothetical protein
MGTALKQANIVLRMEKLPIRLLKMCASVQMAKSAFTPIQPWMQSIFLWAKCRLLTGVFQLLIIPVGSLFKISTAKNITVVRLPVNKYPAGNYSIEITYDDSNQTSKFIIGH